MAKILIMTIQVNLSCLLQVSLGCTPNSPELSLLKFLPFTYHFLAATLDFTSFFNLAFLEAAPFFYSLAVFD